MPLGVRCRFIAAGFREEFRGTEEFVYNGNVTKLSIGSGEDRKGEGVVTLTTMDDARGEVTWEFE